MNISSVTSNNSGNYTFNGPSSSLGNRMDREIQQLVNMKSQLQEQIQKTTESDIDVKEKQLRIKDLKSQMQEIDSQIKQQQTEKFTQKKKNEEAPKQEAVNADPVMEEQGNGQLAAMTNLVLADLTYTKAQAMNMTKKSFEGEANVLKKEMKLDAGRGFVSSMKSDRIAEIESRVKELDNNVAGALGDVNDKITQSTEDVKHASDAIRERANEEEDKDVNQASIVNPNSNEEEDPNDKRAGYKAVDIRV